MCQVQRIHLWNTKIGILKKKVFDFCCNTRECKKMHKNAVLHSSATHQDVARKIWSISKWFKQRSKNCSLRSRKCNIHDAFSQNWQIDTEHVWPFSDGTRPASSRRTAARGVLRILSPVIILAIWKWRATFLNDNLRFFFRLRRSSCSSKQCNRVLQMLFNAVSYFSASMSWDISFLNDFMLWFQSFSRLRRFGQAHFWSHGERKIVISKLLTLDFECSLLSSKNSSCNSKNLKRFSFQRRKRNKKSPLTFQWEYFRANIACETFTKRFDFASSREDQKMKMENPSFSTGDI